MVWCGIEDVHSDWHTVSLPAASRGLWSPEGVVEDVLWHAVGQAGRQACTVGVVWLGLGRALGRGVTIASTVMAAWLGYCVPDAQQ